MKTMKKIFAMCLALMMIVSCIPTVYAADHEEYVAPPVDPALIDESAVGSLTVYKYDITNGATRS